MAEAKKKKVKTINTIVLSMAIAIIVALCSYVVPAGEFTRETVNGQTLVVAGTYHTIENSPIGLWQFFQQVPKALTSNASSIWMIFIISGMVAVLDATGALQTVLKKVLIRARGKEELVIIGLSIFFTLLGGTGTFLTPIIAVLPIGVMVAKGMGYDGVVGLMITYGACAAGFNAGWANIYSTVVGQEIAELPILSGIGWRILENILFLAIILFVTIRYARKVKADPSKSLCTDFVPEAIDVSAQVQEDKLNGRQILALLITVLGFAFMVYASLQLKWGTDDLTSLFFVMAVLIGLFGGLGPNRTASEFCKGLAGTANICIVIGLARLISLTMENAKIIDTIVYYASMPITAMGPILGILGMFIFNLLFNCAVPGATSQCYIVMPIMVPMADLAGISRQVAIEAYKLGDGISNMLWPTVPTFMACLSLIKVPYTKWVKWALPWLGAVCAAGYVIMVIMQLVGA